MTMPDERTRAVLQTRQFLTDLANGRMSVPPEVRERAFGLLRHYPSAADLDLAHAALPVWFGPATARSTPGVGG